MQHCSYLGCPLNRYSSPHELYDFEQKIKQNSCLQKAIILKVRRKKHSMPGQRFCNKAKVWSRPSGGRTRTYRKTQQLSPLGFLIRGFIKTSEY